MSQYGPPGSYGQPYGNQPPGNQPPRPPAQGGYAPQFMNPGMSGGPPQTAPAGMQQAFPPSQPAMYSQPPASQPMQSRGQQPPQMYQTPPTSQPLHSQQPQGSVPPMQQQPAYTGPPATMGTQQAPASMPPPRGPPTMFNPAGAQPSQQQPQSMYPGMSFAGRGPPAPRGPPPPQTTPQSAPPGPYTQQQPAGYPPQQQQQQLGRYPPQQQQPAGYPPQQQQQLGGYPPQQQQQPAGYPPQQQQQGGYPPQQQQPAGYPPQQQQQGGYPPQQQQPAGYPPQQQQQGAPRPSKPAPRIDPSQIPRLPVPGPGTQFPQYSSVALLNRTVAENKVGPPIAALPFRTRDDGNATPRYMRPTLHHCPGSREVLSQVKQPFGVFVTPMADPEENEEPLACVDFSQTGPVRCTRCKGYVSVFVKWVSDGAKWQCNLCGMVNETPSHYYCGLDGHGLRFDAGSRPELSRGSVDFVVTKDYCVRPPQSPIYVFCVDASVGAMQSGLTSQFLQLIVDNVRSKAFNGAKPRVGIVTFDNRVTFHQVKKDTNEVSTLLMVDVEEPFSPLPSSQWLVDVVADDGVSPATDGIQALVDHILSTAAQTGSQAGASAASYSTSCGIAAVSAVSNGLHLDGGRVYLLSHGAPLVGLGWIRPREHANDYGTEREEKMYRPLSTSSKAKEEKETAELYQRLGNECAARQVALTIFLTDGVQLGSASRGGLQSSWSDAATLAQLPQMTGGALYYLDNAILSDGTLNPLVAEQLEGNLRIALDSVKANETVLKIRCSQGLRCVQYDGMGIQRTEGEVEAAVCDSFTTWFALLRHDSALKQNERVYMQAALLFTSPTGQRMVRVHNLCMLASLAPAEIFRVADLDCIFTSNVRSLIQTMHTDPLKKVRDNLTEKCADALLSYRTTCAKTSPPGQLILPESLKLMPCYSLGVLKSLAMRQNAADGGRGLLGPDPRADERAYVMHLMAIAGPAVLYRLAQPRLYDVIELKTTPRVCTLHLSADRVLLLDAGTCFYLWVGKDVESGVLMDLFGTDSVANDSPPELSDGGELAEKVRILIEELRHGLPFYAPVKVIIAGPRSADEIRFATFLFEDKTKHEISYVDYLCAVHRRIQQKMG